jgi:pimeloyl-ACP methyl ester carboxylesterase
MIVAGAEDRAADYTAHALRLHRDVPNSTLRIWPDTGHMVHHSRALEVVDAIEDVFRAAG